MNKLTKLTFESWFTTHKPTISTKSALAVIALNSEGATIPFIARYRKEVTGNLDEVAIQEVLDAKENYDDIIKKQAYIKSEIEKNEKLSEEQKKEIINKSEQLYSLEKLEDLFLPYKQKKKTKATKAREAGLQELADWIWDCGHGLQKPKPGQTLDLWAFTYKNEEHKILTSEDALSAAQDILIERISEILELRQWVRKILFDEAILTSDKSKKAKDNSKFEKYFNFQEKVSSLTKPENSHRYLALRRGWMEEELNVRIGGGPKDSAEAKAFDSKLLNKFESFACTDRTSECSTLLLKAASLALFGSVVPSIENEIHHSLKKVADEAAIKVFSENVKKLLMASPYGPKAVMGIDPGIRTGCKVAVVDSSGKFIGNTVMFYETESQQAQAKILLKGAIEGANITAIAVGNGTAGRETESFLRKTLKELNSNIPVVMVNESGASVYSASAVAREEFPKLDVTVRGAISIARRLQDPIAELVKVDPKSIGVGQYQHDVNQNTLKKSLDNVVDICVNSVGVNLNTASHHLLSKVSGIGPGLAKSITEYRSKSGLFKSREQLLEVSRFTKKSFEQAAGFLRIPEATNPLDNTGVHPERYFILEEFAKKIGKSLRDLIGNGVELIKKSNDLKDQIGSFTFNDIVTELEKPGRDPREEFSAFQFREDIHEVKDLEQEMICPGIVTNVTNFGAFVDIGVHQDGLVHISQLSDKFIKDPNEIVSPGDHVKVKILEVNLAKNQIALTMKLSEKSLPRKSSDQSYKNKKNVNNQNLMQKTNVHKPNKPEPKSKEIFNNAFSALAGIKISNKK